MKPTWGTLRSHARISDAAPGLLGELTRNKVIRGYFAARRLDDPPHHSPFWPANAAQISVH
jgi:hypothetical protein